ncbi:MAG TPA: tripartite tricarboxylate transporter substrate binding protein [Herbaspirillum sp.]|jgi:putative tricarboxylic transport membrane protein|nr:tripartite tricarboxylate transporter substrate binding protein [Herbaspirillum sp.]
MRIKLKHLSGLLAFGALLSVANASNAADAWKPTRPIQIVVPSAPGGGLDLVARTLQNVITQEKLSDQPITVLNRPGGGGTVGISYINSHHADGHYVTVQALPLVTNQITGLSKIGIADVTPLAVLFREPIIFAVAGDSALKTGQDVVALLRKDPAGVGMAVSSSPGGQSHIAAAMVVKAAGQDPRHLKIVFFDSGGEAMTALMGGHVTVAASPVGVAAGPAQAGKIRMIGIPQATRAPDELANVPTWKEQGIDVDFSTWRVLVGPKDMPAEQTAWWDNVLKKAMASPEWAAALKRNMWSADYRPSKQAAEFLKSENARLTPLLGELGLAKQ